MIKARNIIKSYQNGESRFQVLKDISLDIEDNDFVVILGASGSGKSTFLNVISGLERPDSGKVFYDGKDITALSDNELTSFRKENVGFIFQQYYLLPNMSVDKNVKMGADLANNKDYKNVIRAVGLGEKLHKYPSELSGGEQQRVSIARALATEPKVILCDEATSALDPNTTKSILALLKDLNRKMGITVVVITHEMDVISSICDNVAIIDKGDIVERGPVKEIFESPKSHIGKQLIMGDAIKETDFSGGRYFRITFDGREAGEPVISNLVLRTKVPVNIMYAQTKAIGNKAVGEMVIQFSENEENVDSALNYLETVNIPFEEVTENDF